MPLFSHASELDKGLDAFAKKQWKKARAHLEDARAEGARAVCDYHLGLLYWRGLGGEIDAASALRCLRRAADDGHAAAQTTLALALEETARTDADRREAESLFRSAAGAGDPAAMTELSSFCSRADALDLLERASAKGHPPAMRRLSDLWLEEDVAEALAWIYVAAGMTGDAETIRRAKTIADEMTAREISAAQKLGKNRLKRLRKEAKAAR
jgi:TPR repeat protein